MMSLKRLYITGYRNFELGIFQEKDEKIKIIKKVLRIRLIEYIESGVEWFLISGNLGTEYWTSQVLVSLKEDYPEIQWSVIFPFANFGEQWNEQNQEKLVEMKQNADYVNATSHAPYENPGQLKSHTAFILRHTEGCLLLYDEEFLGKTSYFLQDAKRYKEQTDYQIDTITMDDLQNCEYY